MPPRKSRPAQPAGSKATATTPTASRKQSSTYSVSPQLPLPISTPAPAAPPPTSKQEKRSITMMHGVFVLLGIQLGVVIIMYLSKFSPSKYSDSNRKLSSLGNYILPNRLRDGTSSTDNNKKNAISMRGGGAVWAKNPDAPKFLLYAPYRGSLADQTISLLNAALLAKKHNLILVLSPAFSPGGAGAFRAVDDTAYIYTMGTYYDKTHFEKTSGVRSIFMEEFMDSVEGQQLLYNPADSSFVPTPVPYFLSKAEEEPLIRKMYVRDKDWKFNLQPVDFAEEFKTHPYVKETGLGNCFAVSCLDPIMDVCKTKYNNMSCRAVLLGSLSSSVHSCNKMNSDFDSLKASLKPVPELKRTVDEFLDHYKPAPIISMEVEFLGAVDSETTFFSVFKGQVEKAMAELKSKNASAPPIINLVGKRRSNTKFRTDTAQEYLVSEMNLDAGRFTDIHTHLPNVAVDRKDGAAVSMSSWTKSLDPRTFPAIFSSEFTMAVVDLWGCVVADVFVGKHASSFSFLAKGMRATDGKTSIMY